MTKKQEKKHSGSLKKTPSAELLKIDSYLERHQQRKHFNQLNFIKMKTTQTTTAQKPSLLLKVLAILIAIKGLFFLVAAIYTAFTNLL